MSTDALFHDPASGGNPYGTPWGRTPELPGPGEPVEVGVRADGLHHVTVEWETAGEPGTVVARPDNGGGADGGGGGGGAVLRARIGPFHGPARYRFAAGDTRTPWYDLPATRWQEQPFTGVHATDGTLGAAFGEHTLRLEPGRQSLQWRVAPGGVASSGTAAEVVATGLPDAGSQGAAVPVTGTPDAEAWRAEVADGWLLLTGPSGRWELAPPAWLLVDGVPRELRLGWKLAEGERLYGTGERFDAVDQRGRRPDVRVYEQYKQQASRTYFPLPMLVSGNGYGFSIDTAERVRFDLGATQPDRCTVRVPGTGELTGTYRLGTPADLVRAYTGAVGRPSPLPLWAYGPWMSGNEWNSDRRVREVVQRTVDLGIPASVVVIEAWSDETTFYLFNDTTSDPVPGGEPVPVEAMRHSGRWPDPRGLVDWLHDQGLRVLLWQIPVLKASTGHAQHDADVAHAQREGFCVATTAAGSYRNRGWWFPGARIIDFTNPRARDWWFSKRAWLLDHLGVDGFKTDGGEHLWGADVVTAAGERGDAAGNAYATHYLGAYHGFLRAHRHDRPVTFSRAGFTGAQAFPVHWAGDEDSTWEACRAALVAGLSAGLSGIAFWSWDLAGFSGPLPSAELYRRSAAMAAFCPVMQYHSELNEYREPPIDRTPWNVAEQAGAPEVVDTYRFYARLRMNLVPYLAMLGHQAADEGTPLMRAMVLEEPGDEHASGIEDQFFLGPDLLVAPVLEPGVTKRQVYLPPGPWVDLWSAEPVEPGWSIAHAPIGTIPVYAPGGAVVPLWMPEDVALGAPVGLPGTGGRLVLMVVAGTGRRMVRDPLTEQAFAVETRLDGGEVIVEARDLPSPVAVWLRGSVARAPGDEAAAAGTGPPDGLLLELSPSAPSLRARMLPR